MKQSLDLTSNQEGSMLKADELNDTALDKQLNMAVEANLMDSNENTKTRDELQDI
jgi:hypothetical protein